MTTNMSCTATVKVRCDTQVSKITKQKGAWYICVLTSSYYTTLLLHPTSYESSSEQSDKAHFTDMGTVCTELYNGLSHLCKLAGLNITPSDVAEMEIWCPP